MNLIMNKNAADSTTYMYSMYIGIYIFIFEQARQLATYVILFIIIIHIRNSQFLIHLLMRL